MFSSNATQVSAVNYIEQMFSTYLYTGNGATQTITNGIDLAGEGGLVWIKNREQAVSHALFTTDIGPSKSLGTNTTSAIADGGAGNEVSQFNSNGFSLGPNSLASVNTFNRTYASWTFRKQPKFFDVVTYTGDEAGDRTLNHSLDSTPGCIIIKITNAAGYDWHVYHTSLGTGKFLVLNSTAAQLAASIVTATTTNTFTVSQSNGMNQSGKQYVAYLFAHNAGGFGLSGNENVVSCGSYTGVTYPDSLEVTLGFEPQWVMIKNATTASGWAMWDVMRGMSVIPAANTAQALLLEPNTTAADSNQPGIYPTPTGFVVKNGLTSISGTGDTITYIAIRRGPMKVPTDGTKVYNADFYNGANSPPSWNSGFVTDLGIWKDRTGGASNAYDRLRGEKQLQINSTGAESTDTTAKFDYMNGFGTGSGAEDTTLISWNFRRAPGFFDEVCYTGTGATQTQAHNLGAIPELMIFKQRTGTARSWGVYVAALGNASQLLLNSDSNVGAATTFLNSTSPTASIFTVGSSVLSNQNGSAIVAYLFATCPGVSKVGSYTGTGTTQAIACGFTTGARFVMIKRTDNLSDWYVWDSARGIVAGNDPYLTLNTTAAEVTGTDYVDTSSAGFEISSTAPAEINANGGSYIFLAVA